MEKERRTRPPTFSKDQRQQLLKLGVSDSQILELQSNGLPAVATVVRSLPKMQDVRDELSEVSTALRRSQRAISKLLSANDTAPARSEALLRVQSVSLVLPGELEPLEHALAGLKVCDAAVSRAKEDLEALGQRRFRAGHPRPIQRIEAALLQGFVKGRDPSRPMPEYLIKVSSSPTSVFRRIVGICYEAAGVANTDPERAMKAYIAQRKKLRANQRQRAVKLVTLMGRPGPKKD